MSGVGHPGGDPETPLTAGPERAVAVREIPAGGERKYGRRICPVCGYYGKRQVVEPAQSPTLPEDQSQPSQ